MAVYNKLYSAVVNLAPALIIGGSALACAVEYHRSNLPVPVFKINIEYPLDPKLPLIALDNYGGGILEITKINII